MEDREYVALLIKDLQIEVCGSRITQLVLNRHMPKVEKVGRHSHEFDQILLYLRGVGTQVVEREELPVRRGSAVFLRSGRIHGFKKEQNASPICMAINAELADSQGWQTTVNLAEETIRQIEGGLHRLGKSTVTKMEFAIAAEVVSLISVLEQAFTGQRTSRSGRTETAVKKYIETIDLNDISPLKIAEEMEMSINALNRRLYRENQTSAGQLITEYRFETAGRLLLESSQPIGEVAAEVGFLDQNYFARWFRRHSGVTPTQWRKGAGG